MLAHEIGRLHPFFHFVGNHIPPVTSGESHDKGEISFLNSGAAQISQDFNVSGALPDVIVGIILFFIIGCEFFINYRIVFRHADGGKEAVK